MPNEAAPRIPVVLDRPRTLLFDFNALALFEEATGLSVLAGGMTVGSVRELRAFLWAGLRHEDPDLTLEDVGRMVHSGNMAALMAQITAALSLAMPKASEPEDEPVGEATGAKSPRNLRTG